MGSCLTVFCVFFLGKVVTGIALPSGSDKLYTASKDETLRIWDCASGQVLICLLEFIP